MKLKQRRFDSLVSMVVSLLLLAVMFVPKDVIYADDNKAISVYLNSQKLTFDVEPVMQNDRVLVPMRKIFEELGAEVVWDQEKSKATAKKGDLAVSVTVNNYYAHINQNVVKLDTYPVIKSGRTLVPLRFISESLGAKVSWENDKRSVIISMAGNIAKPDIEKNTNTGTDVNLSVGSKNGEENAVWISFLEYMKMPKNEVGFKKEFSKMLDESKEIGINSVIAHVRSHSDAMYPSAIYPYSRHLTGQQGKEPGYHPLAYMIAETHKRGMKFHAWINPYRVSSYGTYFNETSDKSLAKMWLSDNDPGNDRWVLNHKGDYYLNPSYKKIQDMVIEGVREIVKNYDIDGIHFDDYFYPSVNDSKPELSFDLPEYQLYSGNKSIEEYRKDNVNELVKGVYAAIKAEKPNVRFGISPAGNLVNLRSKNAHFVDIDRWLREDGYVDYIMPQLYWGFETKKGNELASYAYENNIKSWKKLIKNPKIDLYVGLSVVNVGTNVPDGNTISEWLRHNDILARQVTFGRENGVVGYAYFRYEFFNKPESKAEIENLKKVIK